MSSCNAQTSQGQPCRSRARLNSEFCFFHDPASRRHRREAQRKGGSKRPPPVPAPPPHDFDFNDLKQIKELLRSAANPVAPAELDPECAYPLSPLAGSPRRPEAPRP